MCYTLTERPEVTIQHNNKFSQLASDSESSGDDEIEEEDEVEEEGEAIGIEVENDDEFAHQMAAIKLGKTDDMLKPRRVSKIL